MRILRLLRVRDIVIYFSLDSMIQKCEACHTQKYRTIFSYQYEANLSLETKNFEFDFE